MGYVEVVNSGFLEERVTYIEQNYSFVLAKLSQQEFFNLKKNTKHVQHLAPMYYTKLDNGRVDWWPKPDSFCMFQGV